MPECVACFLPSGYLSDHSPCVVSFLDYSINNWHPFKFFNMWNDHESFLDVIREAWDVDIYGTDQFIFCRKLKLLKQPLKLLNSKHYSHISTRATKAKKDLDDALVSLHDDPTNPMLQDYVKALRNSCWKLCVAKRNFYVQKAKCKHLVDGDRVTKFFHDLVKRNCKRNYIATIVKDDGSRSSSLSKVGDAIVHYYRALLSVEVSCEPISHGVLDKEPKVPIEAVEDLCKSVTHGEVHELMFKMGNDKAASPDGYSALFFKKVWCIVGDDVSKTALKFFNNGSMLKQFNHASIALIPKGSHASSVSDHKPISYCNVVYKAISKILTNWLTSVLPLLADKALAAFVKGRCMTSNIHFAQELVL
jgi:hypothetical protein